MRQNLIKSMSITGCGSGKCSPLKKFQKVPTYTFIRTSRLFGTLEYVMKLTCKTRKNKAASLGYTNKTTVLPQILRVEVSFGSNERSLVFFKICQTVFSKFTVEKSEWRKRKFSCSFVRFCSLYSANQITYPKVKYQRFVTDQQ